MFGFVSYRGRAQVLLAAVGAFSFGVVSQAELLPGYAVGTGSSTSSLIIDFAFDGGDAYLFEFHHDGNVNGEDMLLTLDIAGSFDVATTVFDFGTPEAPLLFLFIDGFSFDGNSSIPDFNTTGTSWVYWLADEPVADPATWAEAGTGPSGRMLSDGSLEGWSINVSPWNSLDLAGTDDPPTDFSAATIAQVSSELIVLPVPEPSSAGLLTLAGAALLRRRRA
mgnify:CR=1 FL=1